MRLAAEANEPLSVNQPWLVGIDCRRWDAKLGVVLRALASRHAVSGHELDIHPPDSQRDRHIIAVELCDPAILDGGIPQLTLL